MFGFRFMALVFGLLLAGGCAERDGGQRGRDDAAVMEDEEDASVDAGVLLDANAAADDSAASAGDGSLDAGVEAGGGGGADASPAAIDAAGLDAEAAAPAEDAGAEAGRPPQSPTAMYRVEQYIGGLDHLIIHKQDEARGYCVLVRITSPGTSPGDSRIALPQGWGLVYVLGVESGACLLAPLTPQALTHHPSQAEGRIVFREVTAGGQVCSLDLDLVVTFGGDAGAVPPVEHLFASNVAVACTR